MNRPGKSLILLESCADDRAVVICIPHAGAGVATFVPLARSLRETAAVWAVRFPGREKRIFEPPLTSIADMAASILPEIQDMPTRKVMLLGHCSGAFVAYELAWQMSRSGRDLEDSWLVVSSQSPPLTAGERPPGTEPPARQPGLREYLAELGGTAETVLAHPEILELLAPALQAEFLAIDKYRIEPGRPGLSISLAAIGGRSDETVSHEDLLAWKRHAGSRFSCEMVNGGHFFWSEQVAAVSEILRHLLTGEHERATGSGS